MMRLVGFLFIVGFGSILNALANHDPRHDAQFICEIQERLNSIGYDAGPVDGKVGEKTRKAVGSFLSQIKQHGKGYSPEQVVSFLRSYSERLDLSGNKLTDVPSLGRPANGRIYYQNNQNSIAPLEIKTAKQGFDYYIKISEIDTNEPVKTIYLRSGSSVQIKVPLGNFLLKYATGEKWFGEKCLFGLETLYNKADQNFEFKQIGNQISGYSVELIIQRDGNLSTQKISADDW